MTPERFERSLADPSPPVELSAALAALWWAAKDDWNKAHALVMADDGTDAAWVHAFLHRVEGDLPNARYWYRAAGRPESMSPLAEERAAITASLLLIRRQVD